MTHNTRAGRITMTPTSITVTEYPQKLRLALSMWRIFRAMLNNTCIVKHVPSGKFAIRRGWIDYSYLGTSDAWWIRFMGGVSRFAFYDTVGEARTRLSAYLRPTRAVEPKVVKPKEWERVK